eukprot:scaffold11899_cov40-Prasinocladus_malaysianus.AAC.2
MNLLGGSCIQLNVPVGCLRANVSDRHTQLAQMVSLTCQPAKIISPLHAPPRQAKSLAAKLRAKILFRSAPIRSIYSSQANPAQLNGGSAERQYGGARPFGGLTAVVQTRLDIRATLVARPRWVSNPV